MDFLIWSTVWTEQQIEDVGRRHGEDGIMFYPPSIWGTDKTVSTIYPKPATDFIYKRGYEQGKLLRS